MSAAPPFTLPDAAGVPRVFPTGRDALVCFVKEDCPTCQLAMPLIELAAVTWGQAVDVWAVGQEAAGNAHLVEQHGLTLPMLDDTALRVSFAYDLDSVPTLVLARPDGTETARVVGFMKQDWRDLFARLAVLTGVPEPEVDWDAYPAYRPGCGSKSVEPGIYERLVAESTGSPLRARRIDVGESDDIFEFMFEQGLTDGLPVIPPTPERVLRMLRGTKRDAQESLGPVPPNLGPLTVEKVAINAVMAGCKPEYMPVVLAAVEAVLDHDFNIHGVLATTHFPGPVIIVNGPIRDRIGMNYRMNVLGQGNRANATIGRAVQLIVRNVGGGRPGEVDRAALGQPGKFTMCFAEFEERSNWEPLHVTRGFAAEDSTVTVFAGGAPAGIIDQLSRDAQSLARTYGMALAAAGHPKHYRYGEIVVAITPEHVDTIAKNGWTKAQFIAAIQEATLRPAREVMRSDENAEGLLPATVERIGLETRIPKFADDANVNLVVCGGEAGKWGAYFMGWVSGPTGSSMVTHRIRD